MKDKLAETAIYAVATGVLATVAVLLIWLIGAMFFGLTFADSAGILLIGTLVLNYHRADRDLVEYIRENKMKKELNVHQDS